MALVKLKIRSAGDRYQVTLTSPHRNFEAEGFLPPIPSALKSAFADWQSSYYQHDEVRGFDSRLTPINTQRQSGTELAEAVKTQLNQWLNAGHNEWRPIRDGLIRLAHEIGEEPTVMLDVKEVELRRLPWQEWNLIEEHYSQSEVALRAFRNPDEWKSNQYPTSSKVRILIVVGQSDGIKTEDDMQAIERLKALGAEVTSLIQPTIAELQTALHDELGYDILIFSGHSRSCEDGQIGWIELNDHASLSVDDLKNALRDAIRKGLQLAIFNSCDGLGLANALAQLHLPQCIVMREPVPDQVAIEFLQSFFKQFAQHHKPLSTSVHIARGHLEQFQRQYPGATWLPTICIKSDAKPLTWQMLVERSQSSKRKLPKAPLWIIPIMLIGGGVLAWNLWRSQSPPSGKSTSTVDCPSTPIPAESTLRIRGSGSMVPLTEELKRGFQACFPGTQVDAFSTDSAAGIADLLNGKADVAAISRPLTVQELNAGLQATKVGEDPISLFVRKDNLFQGGLTQAQIKGIFSGTITNWAEVGGISAPLRFINSHPQGGTHQVLRDLVLNKDGYGSTPNIETLPMNTGLPIRVKRLGTDGISYHSYLSIKNQQTIRILKIDGKLPSDPKYPYRRPFYYVYKNSQSQAVKAFLEYIQSPNGEKALQKALRSEH
jgi:ABC-type phosphate transport system substrate-binding protein